jgi:hypothetical protein
MTYKFEQFKIEIVNPTITINLNTISDKALDKLLAVDVLLTTDSAQFGVRAEDMPYVDSWDDADVPDMVNNWLAQYAV